MASKDSKLRVVVCMLLLAVVAAAPAFAGSAVIGSVAGSTNATMGGQPLLPNTTVFSGDSLQVNDGVAVLAVDKSSRMVFGRETTASFLREPNEVTVLLSRGNLSMYHPQDAVALRVKVGEVTVVPAKGFKTLGEVAMIGSSIVITAKEGSFRVEGNGSAREVVKGQTITVPAKAARAAGSSPAAPQGLAGGVGLQAASVAASGVAAVLAGISISRANDARDAGNAANSTAAAALAQATAANSNAVVAISTAAGADADVVHVGCALDTFANNLGQPSPYKTPTTCP